MSLEREQRLFKPLEPISGGAPTSAETQILSLPNDVGRYLNHLAVDNGSTDNTVSAYRNDLYQLCDFLGTSEQTRGEFDWNMVTKGRLVAFAESLNKHDYATATLARKVACVKSFFHYLTKEGVVKEDPTEELDSPKKVNNTLPHILSPEELDRLVAGPEAKLGPEALRDRAMLWLLRETGMRVTELMSLNDDDVNLDTYRVRVIGKDGKKRLNPFGARTRQAIWNYQEKARPYLTRNLQKPQDALFVNHRGERLTREGFWQILKEYVRTAEIEGPVSPHTLRHSFAVHQLENGLSLGELQDLLGHAYITATRTLYGQAAKSNGL